MTVPLVLWVGVIIAVYATVVMAVMATRPGHHWLVAPSVIPVLGAIVLPIGAPSVPAPPPTFAVALTLGFVMLGVISGSPLVGLVLRLATRGTVALGTHGGILVRDTTAPAPAREILRGGATIGYLERLALIGSVLAGQSAAVAVIVAIKGLGRFSELENGQARERFIIGTLSSLIWAGACTAAIILSH
ncbi:MAG: hypothetical protein ACYCZY_04155 [Lacisediminihabitans sp.]